MENIVDYLNTLEKLIDETSMMNFKNNKNAMFNVIDDIREQLPAVIREAERIKAEQREIIDTANSRADQILITAQQRAQVILDNNNITKKIQFQNEELLNNAKQDASNIIAQAKQTATNIRNRAASDSAKQLANANMETDRLYTDSFNYASYTLNNLEETLSRMLADVSNKKQKLNMEKTKK